MYWVIPAGDSVFKLPVKQTVLLVSKEESHGVECSCMIDEATLNDKAIR